MRNDTTTDARRSLLILSFSPIRGDARVLKQVEAFVDEYDVTTCGYGPAPDGVAAHVQIPDDILHNVLDDKPITRRNYRRAYWSLWSIEWARNNLRRKAWDIVLANDVEAVPIALALKPPLGVHADLHEYSPLLHEDWQGWREKITPYLDWVCRTYVARASSWTTVSGGLAREYERNFGFRAELVTNAAPYQDFAPTPVGQPIRLVHSGAALGDRGLQHLITAVNESTADVTLDFFLTPNQPAYLDELRAMAEGSRGRVVVHDPVPYTELAATLHRYDVGVLVLTPGTFNNKWALPNKLFDSVQARLGIIVGPNPEMAEYVRRYDLGTVTEDFEPASLTRVLDALTAEQVVAWKAASHEAAHELSAETQVEIWRSAIARLAAGDGRRRPRG